MTDAIAPAAPVTIPINGSSTGATATSLTGNPTDFKLDVSPMIDSTQMNTALTNPITQQDLADAIASNKNLAAKVASESVPTNTENSLNSQLSTLRASEDAAKLGLQRYENALPGEGISAGAIQGRDIAMSRSVNMDLQTMAAQEKNLMTQLGLATTARTNQLKVDQGTMTENDKTISNYNAIQNAIDKQLTTVNNTANKLTANAKSTLTTIFTHFKGVAWADLSSDAQNQITTIAQNAGIPIDVVQAGMDANASQVALTALKTQTAINKSNGTGTSGGNANLTATEKKFQTTLTGEQKKLAKGGDWGASYNYLANLYGKSNPELITPLTDAQKQQLTKQGYKVNPQDQTMLDILLGKSQY